MLRRYNSYLVTTTQEFMPNVSHFTYFEMKYTVFTSIKAGER